MAGYGMQFLVIVVLSFAVIKITKVFMTNVAGVNFAAQTKSMSKLIQLEITSEINTLERYALTMHPKKYLTESNSKFERMAAEGRISLTHSPQKDNALDHIPRDVNGNDVALEIKRIFSDYSLKEYGYRAFEDVVIINKYGVVVAASNPADHYCDENIEWWRAAKEKGFYISPVHYEKEKDDYIITVAKGMTDDKNNFIGVLRADLSFITLMHYTELTRINQTNVTLKLMTSDGHLLYATHAYKFNEDQKQRGYFNKSNQKHGYFSFPEKGRESTLAYAYFKPFNLEDSVNDTPAWILLMKADTRDLLGVLGTIDSFLVPIFIIMGAVFIALSFAVGQSITRPLSILTEAVKRATAGDFSKKVILTADDEFGQVAAALNNMTEQLDKSYKDLDDRNEALEKSNRDLQEFAFIASHDLQEPLRKVKAFGDLLQEEYAGAISGEGAEYIRIMQNAADRMRNLINSLLEYSRITTKAVTFIPVDLSEIAKETVNELDFTIAEVGGNVAIEELPSIEADPTQIKQLFQNLISNGLKYRKKNVQPVIKIYGRTLTESGREICEVHVEDNGIGFDEKYSKRIFGVFQRLHKKTEYEGTGIGLALCKKIVERHGGTITVKSALGQGSTFIVTLPVKQEKE